MPKKTPSTPELVVVGCKMPPELRDRLREVAAQQDRTLSAEIRRAVQAHVEKAAA